MNATHTPTYIAHIVPQDFGPDAGQIRGHAIPVIRIAPQTDAVIVSLGSSREETHRIAEKIAAQWNAHDELVAALREVYAALKKDAADPDTSADVTIYWLDGGTMHKAINTVRAALAKAGAA